MGKTDELFLLVKSLSKSEKRYFKLYAGRHTAGEKNNYLRLFEAIDRQESYDEEKIKKGFRDEKFIQNFFAIKRYLFDVILNSLVDFNRERVTSYRLYEDIMKTNILVSKGLKKSALKLSGKAVQIAKAHSKYCILEELLDIQAEKILAGDAIVAGKRIEKINIERFRTLDELTSSIHYSALYDRLHTFFVTTPIASSREEIKKLDWLTEDPLFKNENNAKGFYAREDLLGIKRRYYWYIGKYDEAALYRKKYIELLDEYPSIKQDEPQKYFLAIHSYLIYAWFTISLTECEEYFTKMKNSANSILKNAKDEFVIKIVYSMSFIMDILWFEKKNEADKIFKKLETLDGQLAKFTSKMETAKLLDIYSATGACLFRMGYYENSLSLTNQVLNYKDAYLLETLYHVNLVRAIVIHYELGNYDIIESLTKKLNRNNRKNKRVLSSEKNLIKSINRLINTVSKTESLFILEDLKSSFEKLSGSLMENIFIIRMGLINWVNKHIQKIK